VNFRFSLTLSATYASDAPTIEVLMDGIVVSSELITTLTGTGTSLLTFDLDYEGAFPPFELRFNDTSTETGRQVRIDNISLNGQHLDHQSLGLSGDAFANSNASSLNSNGDVLTLNSAIEDYMFGINEPTIADFGTPTITGTTANDAALNGTPQDDIIYGDAGSDKISGLAGNDLIDGGDGNDLLLGHDGDDVLVGGEGNDRLFGRNDDDILYGGNGHDKLEGDAGYDILNGGAGDDNIWSGADDDVAYGGEGNDKVRGEEGNDTLYGDAGNDRLEGGDGDDYLNGGDGKDWLYGGEGTDVLEGGAGTDRLFGGNGNDTLNGGEGQDVLYGQEGDDVLDGGDQKDWLYGGEGVDILNGGAGKDRLSGDEGDDFVYGDGGDDIIYGGDSSMFYNATTGNFYKHITTGTNDTTHAQALSDVVTQDLHGATAHLATISSVSEQSFVGTIINGSLWAWIDGSDSATEGVFVYESGPENGSVLDGSLNWQAGTNSGTADNIIIWDGGGDVLYAYAGTNTAYGYIAEWEGADVLTAGGVTSGHDSTAEINILNGGAGNDTIYGSMGNDILNGGADDDVLDGRFGVDTATYETATGSVNVNLDTGVASGADGNDTLIAIENVTGSDFDDTLTGDANNNTINGGAGADIILGGGGSDVLIGGAGNDTIGATNWNTANSAAQASTLNGVSGHLLTINSADEQSFISTVADAGSHFWSGGSDSGAEGVWEWTEGAEAGTSFWNTSGGTGEFANWYNGDDTSNSGTNDHLLILNNGTYSNEWYAYTSTYNAAYMIEWEGADVLAGGFTSNETSNTVTLYGGDGQDTLYGGTGIDKFVFEASSAFNDVDVIENFVAGVGGDALDLSDILSGASGSITDLVNFVDSGGDTLVQVDADGTAGGTNFTTIGQIVGVTGLDEATLLTDGNIIV